MRRHGIAVVVCGLVTACGGPAAGGPAAVTDPAGDGSSAGSASAADEARAAPTSGAVASPETRAADSAARPRDEAPRDVAPSPAAQPRRPREGAVPAVGGDGPRADGPRADGPLGPDARALLAALPSERIPAPQEFYYRSNERRHDLVAAQLAGLGGAIVGVGADQLYTLAGYARSSLVVAVDYDRRVALVHDIYAVLVPRSETPAQLVAQFDDDHEAATIALLRDAFDDLQERQTVQLFRRVRRQMRDYLARQTERARGERPGSWLADPALYDHVRGLFRQGRVVARTGDLTGATTLRAVGSTLGRLGVVVRILYFSNAEQFFPYTPDFRHNMAALPTDDRTVVVRTTRHRSLPNAEGDRWHYVVQDFTDFAERLDAGVYGRAAVMVEDLVAAGPPFVGDGVSRMTTELPRLLLERRRRRAR